MPKAVIEAMASGAVVICTAVGGLPQMVADEENGFIVERSVSSIADRLRALSSDDALGKSMSQAAKRVYRERFSGDAMRVAYERIYI